VGARRARTVEQVLRGAVAVALRGQMGGGGSHSTGSDKGELAYRRITRLTLG